MQNITLKYPPIKYKIPNYFIYKNPKKPIYTLVNKEGKIAGRMNAQKEFVNDNTFYPNLKNYFSLYIKRLFVEKEYRHQKIGTALLNVAKAESKNLNCNGRIHLIAANIEQNGTPPQIFYWKNGFKSQNTNQANLIRESAQTNSPLPTKIKWSTPMYYEV